MKCESHWQSAAYFAAKKHLRRVKTRFLAEDLLKAVIDSIGDTVDRRAFGGVIRSLSADGIIKRAGVGSAKTSNGSLKPYWAKVK